jgi:capsular polysaccharide biosynthesis protein
MRDRWWLLVLTPLLAMALLFATGRFEPYETRVQATVLLPGDTEIPGNSERPELMMLDDLPTLVRSRVFAEGVLQAIPDSGLTVDEVQAALDGSRYSRIVTVAISDGNAETVSEIAAGVEAQLASLINEYLVAEDGDPATVRIINPAGTPTQSNNNLLVQMLLTGVAGFVLGTVIATILGPKGGG